MDCLQGMEGYLGAKSGSSTVPHHGVSTYLGVWVGGAPMKLPEAVMVSTGCGGPQTVRPFTASHSKLECNDGGNERCCTLRWLPWSEA